MYIVYSCDENFAVHAAVSITSLFENNISEKIISVYILGNGISEATKSKLESIGSIYGVIGKTELKKIGSEIPKEYLRKVTVIPIKGFEERIKAFFGDEIDLGKFTATSLARLFAPEYLPEDIKRYIYIDSDTVILKPLNRLFSTELKGNTVGMVPEPTIYGEVKEYLGLKAGEPYYNTGLVLVDRDAWVMEDVTQSCIDFYKEKSGRLLFPDQDIINHCLKGKILNVWQGYNFFSNYHYRSYKSLVKLSSWFGKCISEDEYLSARKAPAIVHFAGDERPWYEGNSNPYRAEYEKYLEISPYSGQAKITGHERDMKMYHVMNIITGICPAARDLISKHYYKKNYGSGK